MEKTQDMLQEKLNDEVKICNRCHRRLKDETSKKLGYGKVCYSKIAKHNNYLFDFVEVQNNE